MRKIKNILIIFFEYFSGNFAYKKYLEHHQKHHGNENPLTINQFLNQRRTKKWRGVNRCC
mgnify:CR=1 FL=1